MLAIRPTVYGGLLVCLLNPSLSAQGTVEAPPPRTQWIIADQRIDESSGLIQSRRVASRWWTHNDSGDKPRLYAIDLPEIGTLETRSREPRVSALTLGHAKAVDWEDIAWGRIDGRSVIWVGDIGDNGARRSQVEIYLFDEPAGEVRDGETLSLRANWSIQYEDGPRDCEAMAYDSEAQSLFLLAKGKLPWAGLYRVTLHDLKFGLGGELGTMEKESVSVGVSEESAEPARVVRAKKLATLPIAMATGMDIREDGLRMAICTYFDCWVFEREAHQRWEDVLGEVPVRYALPQLKQIEAIAFDSHGRLWVTSEGEPLRIEAIDHEP